MIDFSKGLVPAIAQDFENGEVLMLGYMDKKAYELTIKKGFAHYFSRSRNTLWMKGETSGHTQEVKEIFLDCDSDTVLLKVKQNGVACHTGRKSCFYTKVDSLNSKSEILAPTKVSAYDIIDELYHTILDRKLNASPENSYVAKLFKRGENAMLKKICEEAGEFALACKDLSKFENYKDLKRENFGEHIDGNPSYDVVYEASDLIFHLFISLAAHNIHPNQILDELAKRNGISGIDEKNSRKI